MRRRFRFTACAWVLAGSVVLSGCASAAVDGATPATSAAADAAPRSSTNISGDYRGTVQDAQGGTGRATAVFAQRRSDGGGSIKDRESKQTLSIATTLTIDSSNAVNGAMVIDYPPAGSGPTCTFSTSGSYDPTTNQLSGSYVAVSGCAGDTGTYQLVHECHDTVVTGDAARRFNNPHC